MSRYEEIKDKIAAKEAAHLRAKAIVETSEDLKLEVARILCGELEKVLTILAEAKVTIKEAPSKNPGPFFAKWIDHTSNRLTAISAGYRHGSLPSAKGPRA